MVKIKSHALVLLKSGIFFFAFSHIQAYADKDIQLSTTYSAFHKLTNDKKLHFKLDRFNPYVASLITLEKFTGIVKCEFTNTNENNSRPDKIVSVSGKKQVDISDEYITIPGGAEDYLKQWNVNGLKATTETFITLQAGWYSKGPQVKCRLCADPVPASVSEENFRDALQCNNKT